MDYLKWFGCLYEVAFRANATRAMIGCTIIGLTLGATLFFVCRTSYARIAEERAKLLPTATESIEVNGGGNGNANVGNNSGTVTVDNK